MLAVLRSLGFLGGLPRLVSMPLNISRKIAPSTIASRIYYIYNKSRHKKPRRCLAGWRRGNKTELSPDSA
jgi:hypothetical protein